jgi:hypothetical protein
MTVGRTAQARQPSAAGARARALSLTTAASEERAAMAFRGRLPGTSIFIDAFSERLVHGVYFLTHLHADHLRGLSADFGGAPLFCSEVTRRLLLAAMPGLAPDVVRVLPVGEPVMLPLAGVRETHVTVTALDANHCPGAVMLLLEGAFGRVLHTGDFRFDPEMLAARALQPYLAGPAVLDCLYLDCTFAAMEAPPRFPTRAEAARQLVQLVREHPHAQRVLLACDTLGSEDVLLALHREFGGARIGVECPLRWRELQAVGGLDHVFVRDLADAAAPPRFRLVPSERLHWRALAAQQDEPHGASLFIRPSALWFCAHSKLVARTASDGSRAADIGELRPVRDRAGVFHVPFATHSTYAELVAFVSRLRPRDVVPLGLPAARGGAAAALRRTRTLFRSLVHRTLSAPQPLPEARPSLQLARSASAALPAPAPAASHGDEAAALDANAPTQRACPSPRSLEEARRRELAEAEEAAAKTKEAAAADEAAQRMTDDKDQERESPRFLPLGRAIKRARLQSAHDSSRFVSTLVLSPEQLDVERPRPRPQGPLCARWLVAPSPGPECPAWLQPSFWRSRRVFLFGLGAAEHATASAQLAALSVGVESDASHTAVEAVFAAPRACADADALATLQRIARRPLPVFDVELLRVWRGASSFASAARLMRLGELLPLPAPESPPLRSRASGGDAVPPQAVAAAVTAAATTEAVAKRAIGTAEQRRRNGSERPTLQAADATNEAVAASARASGPSCPCPIGR